ncbi:MAG: alpha/beta hydrolase [Christensenellaceae bacterium]|jgi:pimeloyl-ACP methyl ester carboxylesterase|nr:alpha/beta hydrolase [Christensenellaceae bacterium]
MKTILFLHGWGGNSNSFLPIINYFKNFYNCIAPTFPIPENKVFILKDFVAMVQDIKCDYIIAHSFGARIAVFLNCEKMVITGGAGLKPKTNLIKWIKKKLKIPSADYRVLNNLQKQTFKNIINYDISKDIKQTPTLLICGQRDKATPVYMAKKWHKINGNSILKIYKNCGHFAYLENKERFIKDVEQFLI